MSHFYGTLQGSRGTATRCGTKNSGLQTNAAGWRGAIQVTIFEDNGVDRFKVSLVPWQNSGGQSVVLATGELDSNAERARHLDTYQAGELSEVLA